MYLHIGSGQVVRHVDLIGIFDLDNLTYEKNSRDYLNQAEKKGTVTNISEDLPRSVVITDKENYLSGVNSRTLGKRIEALVGVRPEIRFES